MTIEAPASSTTEGAGFDLRELIELQRTLQRDAYGIEPAALDGDRRKDYVRTMAYALEDEIHEATNELPWKPWARTRDTDGDKGRNRYLSELVDALHFWVNLALVVDATADEIRALYVAKRSRNAERQTHGYDGVSHKCPACRRELDHPDAFDANGVCTGCGFDVSELDYVSRVLSEEPS